MISDLPAHTGKGPRRLCERTAGFPKLLPSLSLSLSSFLLATAWTKSPRTGEITELLCHERYLPLPLSLSLAAAHPTPERCARSKEGKTRGGRRGWADAKRRNHATPQNRAAQFSLDDKHESERERERESNASRSAGYPLESAAPDLRTSVSRILHQRQATYICIRDPQPCPSVSICHPCHRFYRGDIETA